METRINYTLVGLFVISLTITLVGITSWLLADNNNKEFKIFAAYLNESVAGLSTEAPVKYNGVDVGTVRSIRVNPSNPQEVQVLLRIDDSVPISESTSATMVVQGLTGIRYINLTPGKLHERLLYKKPGQRYPVIKTEPSLFVRLDMAVSDLIKDFHLLTISLQTIVNDDNRQAIHKSLQNFAKSSEQFNDMLTVLRKAAGDISDTSKTLNKTASDVNESIQQALPTTLETLEELELTAKRAQDLFEKIDNNPGVLLRGEQGEKNEIH